jgi:hypothetical protein
MSRSNTSRNQRTDRDLNLIGFVWIKLCKFKSVEKPKAREVRKVIEEFQVMEAQQFIDELALQN